jgi:hypothetical protein
VTQRIPELAIGRRRNAHGKENRKEDREETDQDEPDKKG